MIHGDATAEEFVPLADRLAVLLALRVLAAAAVFTLAELGDAARADLVPLTVAYLVIVVAGEVARRRVGPGSSRAVSGMVLVDGAYLAFAVGMTGGSRSPLAPLVFVEIAAVTLLASRRAGAELGIWCAMLVGVARAADQAGFLASSARATDRELAVAAVSFIGCGLIVAGCATVRDRFLGQARSQLAALVELDAAIERERRVPELLEALAAHVCDRLGFGRAAVVVRRDGGWVGATAEAGGDGPDDHHSRPFAGFGDEPLGEHARRVLQTGSPLLRRVLDEDLLGSLLPGAVNIVLVPVGADGQFDGVLAAEWGGQSRARIRTLTVRTLGLAATHAALALRHRTLLDEAEFLATRDPLTGLANRRLLEETLGLEARRSVRAGTPLSLLVFDVDHFKEVNDELGHPSGDMVLRAVSEALDARTKASDLAARLGGDEFAVLLPGCTATDAVKVAERIRSAAVELVSPVHVTLSAGIAGIPEHAVSADELVAAADSALYAAKRGGRDRIATATYGSEVASSAARSRR